MYSIQYAVLLRLHTRVTQTEIVCETRACSEAKLTSFFKFTTNPNGNPIQIPNMVYAHGWYLYRIVA